MKYKVDFLEAQYSGGQKIIETAIYDTELDEIKIKLEDFFDTLLIDNEFIIGKDGKKFSINKDKMKFMENLKYAFSGSMFRASEVEEIK